MSMLLFLFACANQEIENDTFDTAIDAIACVDSRGYKHEPGTFWRCGDRCVVCSCSESGEIFETDSGPAIVTEECSKYTGHSLPRSPK